MFRNGTGVGAHTDLFFNGGSFLVILTGRFHSELGLSMKDEERFIVRWNNYLIDSSIVSNSKSKDYCYYHYFYTGRR
jgi:hypothetical protein